jgi:quinol monooxygenase YgiN
VLVITRFRVGDEAADGFRPRLEAALEVLGAQRGYVDGAVGRNVDDPSLWVLQTRWVGAGAYRRALSAYDVKVNAWALLGQAVEEPSAYEILTPGTETNDPRPRGDR